MEGEAELKRDEDDKGSVVWEGFGMGVNSVVGKGWKEVSSVDL